MPCGTGKSLTAFWIAEKMKSKSILVAVPSLALLQQTLKVWTREFLLHKFNQIGCVYVLMIPLKMNKMTL